MYTARTYNQCSKIGSRPGGNPSSTRRSRRRQAAALFKIKRSTVSKIKKMMGRIAMDQGIAEIPTPTTDLPRVQLFENQSTHDKVGVGRHEASRDRGGDATLFRKKKRKKWTWWLENPTGQIFYQPGTPAAVYIYIYIQVCTTKNAASNVRDQLRASKHITKSARPPSLRHNNTNNPTAISRVQQDGPRTPSSQQHLKQSPTVLQPTHPLARPTSSARSLPLHYYKVTNTPQHHQNLTSTLATDLPQRHQRG